MLKISLITPTFNSIKTIEKCISSVLNQSYENYEHIIIDNKSSDKTLDIITRLYKNAGKTDKLIMLSEHDNGISDAFNKGIKTAKGEIIAILNSDDYYFSSKVFEKVVEAFNDQDILFAHGDIKFIDDVYGSNIRRPLLCNIKEAMPYNHPTMFFRKDIYEHYGIFDTEYKYAMDYEFVCRLGKKIPNFRWRGKYLTGEPLVVQLAGGDSWRNELGSIEEVKKSLIFHKLWDSDAEKFYNVRVKRTRIKKVLHCLKLDFIIRLWRIKKWGNEV